MEHLIVAMENPELSQNLKKYNLYKSEHFFGYGILFYAEDTLHQTTHRLVYPRMGIESRSPAEEMGMSDDQRLVAVNGKFVNKELKCLGDVIRTIEESYFREEHTVLEITALDQIYWKEFMKNPQLVVDLANFKIKSTPDPNIVVPLKKPLEQSFDLVNSKLEEIGYILFILF